MKHEVASNLTKQAFANALKKKMKEKTLSKITVTELIKECGLNRKTFYYHFKDIDALVKWLLKQEMIEIIKQFDVTSEIKDIIYYVISYVKQNHYICERIINSIGYIDMKKFLQQEFKEPVSIAISKYADDLSIPIDYKEFLIDFYTEALIGILISYMISNTDDISNLKLEKKISYLNNFLKYSLPYALNEKNIFTSN